MHLWIVRLHENGKAIEVGTIEAFTMKQATAAAKIKFGGKRNKSKIHVQMVERKMI